MNYFFRIGMLVICLSFFMGCGNAQNIPDTSVTPEDEVELDYLPEQAPIMMENDEGIFSFVEVVEPEQIVGNWQAVEGASYEEIIFDVDGTYSTFLNQKPFVEGTWQIAKGFLIMADSVHGNNIYTDVAIEENMFVVENDDDKIVWQKL